MADDANQTAAEPAEDNRPVSAKRIEAAFGDAVSEIYEYRGEWTVIAPKAVAHSVLAFLKNDPELAYERLTDLTAVDYRNLSDSRARLGGARYAVVYHLFSHRNAADAALRRIRVKTPVFEGDLTAATVSDIWRGANWLEREAWDMFGIAFDGHPDLRRILMPDDYGSHPLRKDYPVQGIGERTSFDFEQSGQTHSDL